jgi:chromosome partitioning protein
VGKIVSFANQKGGVGKTTTAVNLGASLAVLGKSVLIVDVDPQANATSGVGYHLKDDQCCIYECLLNQHDAASIILPTLVPRLSLLPSHPRLVGAEVELVTQQRREFRLATVLNRFRGSYDYIFVDCPPSLGLLTLNGLVASHALLVPIQCEYYAMEGLSSLLKTIKLVRQTLNPSLPFLGVVLTMYDRRVKLTAQVEEEIRAFFGKIVFETVIPRNVKLSEAPSFGKPIVLYDILSRGAESYISLAKEVIARG